MSRGLILSSLFFFLPSGRGRTCAARPPSSSRSVQDLDPPLSVRLAAPGTAVFPATGALGNLVSRGICHDNGAPAAETEGIVGLCRRDAIGGGPILHGTRL